MVFKVLHGFFAYAFGQPFMTRLFRETQIKGLTIS